MRDTGHAEGQTSDPGGARGLVVHREGLALGLLGGGLFVALVLVVKGGAPPSTPGGAESPRVLEATTSARAAPSGSRSATSAGVRSAASIRGAPSAGPGVPVPEERAAVASPPSQARANLREPSAEAIQALERACEARDASALLTLVREDRSLVRFEALRRYVEVADAGALGGLRAVFAETSDPDLIELIGEAMSAGGTSADADALASHLSDSDGRRRFIAARSIACIAERCEVPLASLCAAVEILEANAAEDGALDALADAGQVDALARIASDRGQDEHARLRACERLEALAPTQAAPLLATLAAEARDPGVSRWAAR